MTEQTAVAVAIAETRRDWRSRHGHAANGHTSPEYWVWNAMRQRCENPHDKAYHNYGARGITVCGRDPRPQSGRREDGEAA